MWSFSGLEFIAVSATTPLGSAVLLLAFVISCLCRIFLRRNALKNLYMIVSFGPLLYLVVIGIAVGSPASANAGQSWFVPMLFAMFLGVPFSVGWLLGWPIAVLLRLAAHGPNSSAPEQS